MAASSVCMSTRAPELNKAPKKWGIGCVRRLKTSEYTTLVNGFRAVLESARIANDAYAKSDFQKVLSCMAPIRKTIEALENSLKIDFKKDHWIYVNLTDEKYAALRERVGVDGILSLGFNRSDKRDFWLADAISGIYNDIRTVEKLLSSEKEAQDLRREYPKRLEAILCRIQGVLDVMEFGKEVVVKDMKPQSIKRDSSVPDWLKSSVSLLAAQLFQVNSLASEGLSLMKRGFDNSKECQRVGQLREKIVKIMAQIENGLDARAIDHFSYYKIRAILNKKVNQNYFPKNWRFNNYYDLSWAVKQINNANYHLDIRIDMKRINKAEWERHDVIESLNEIRQFSEECCIALRHFESLDREIYDQGDW